MQRHIFGYYVSNRKSEGSDIYCLFKYYYLENNILYCNNL